MAKYESCEHCGKPRRDGELLSTVDCWIVSEKDGRRSYSYYHVCDQCYEIRQLWCAGVFPDVCTKCGAAIPHAEHFLDTINGRDVKDIYLFGLAPDEICSVVCEACYHQRLPS